MDFCLDLLIRASLGHREEGICPSELCHLLSRSHSNTHVSSLVTALSKKSGSLFKWWRRSCQIAFRLAFCSSDNIRGTNYSHTFLMAKFSVACIKTRVWWTFSSSAIILILILQSLFSKIFHSRHIFIGLAGWSDPKRSSSSILSLPSRNSLCHSKIPDLAIEASL